MGAVNGWGVVVVSAASLASASPEAARRAEPKAPARQIAQTYPNASLAAQPTDGQPSYGQYAAPVQDPWQQYKTRLIALARLQHIRESTIQSVIPGLTVNEDVIALDHAEPRAPVAGGPPSMAPYIRAHVTASLISRGQSRYYDQYSALRSIESRYGVDPAVLMAIYGHETSYGTVTGRLDLLQTLASLAYGGRRRSMFEEEFIDALKLMDQGVPRWALKGSWAGATGYPQFLPSVALRLRADGDGDGYANIWTDELDGLASIASYLHDAGWKPSVPWGVSARVPLGLNREALRSTLNPPRCPQVFRRHTRWLTMREWRSLGVTPVSRSLPESEMATLLEPEGPTGSGYLLTNNYRAILDYNCSNYYAMSVGLLADAIARR